MHKKIAELQEKAAAGDKQALCSLGIRYFWAYGIDRDKIMAFKLFSEAAMQGYPFAISILKGMKFKEGRV